MSQEPEKFRIPDQLEAVLASANAYLASKKKTSLCEILVNSEPGIETEVTYDSWDGGQTGHEISLAVPHDLFIRHLDERGNIESALSEVFNRVASVPGEFIARVRLHTRKDQLDADWRKNSGFLHAKSGLARSFSSSLGADIWKAGALRVFISHVSKDKVFASSLKDGLDNCGMSCFVAHEDIKPTREWQSQIEIALQSMDALVALITPQFHSSLWTDQEIGFALGTGIPVFPVRLGKDPYGFIAKLQGIPGALEDTKMTLVRLREAFASNAEVRERLLEATAHRLENSENFIESIAATDMLEEFDTVPEQILKRIERAIKKNDQVGNAGALQRRLPNLIATLRRKNKA